MRLSVEGDGWGEAPPYRCVILDADGAEVTDCVACDTETGFVRRLMRRPDGSLMLNFAGDGLEILTQARPAPLSVIPVG